MSRWILRKVRKTFDLKFGELKNEIEDFFSFEVKNELSRCVVKETALKVTIAQVIEFATIIFARHVRKLKDLRRDYLNSTCFVDSSSKLLWHLRVVQS